VEKAVESPVAPSAETVADGARRPPAPHLRRYVASYTGYRLIGPPGRHRGLPSPFLTLIITLDEPLLMAAHPDPRQPSGAFDTLLGGLHDRPALITHAGYQAGIQVALRPLGARALLGVPAGELAGIDVQLPDVVGRWADQLRERLHVAASWEERFAVLDEALGDRVDLHREAPGEVAPELSRAWDLLVGPSPGVGGGGGVGVGELAADLGWSPRRLHDRFRSELGIAPKEAARIARFDRARRALFARAVTGRPLRLAELAVERGYYDQAHLAREFRALAGCAPSQLVAEELRFVQAAHLEGDAGWVP
jgi:AraC-like DNA-binding protein